jgi:hypothetical protein
MNTLLQDVRFGIRMLAKNPGFTAVAEITLALGIGATSTIFSWINSTMLDPIPGVADTSKLVSVMRGEWSENPTPPFSYPDYVDLRSRTESFSGLIAYEQDFVSLTGNARPERLYLTDVSANYFDVLGVPPILGRSFSLSEEEETGSTPAVVISYSLWQSHFGADPSVIGKSIEINDLHIHQIFQAHVQQVRTSGRFLSRQGWRKQGDKYRKQQLPAEAFSHSETPHRGCHQRTCPGPVVEPSLIISAEGRTA